jgi:hypothetical protein
MWGAIGKEKVRASVREIGDKAEGRKERALKKSKKGN